MVRATATPLLALVCLLFLVAQTATAQGNAPPGAGQAAPQVTDAMLEDFATAASDVESIQREFSAKSQATQDAGKAKALQAEAQGEMVDAVESSGLSVAQFNTIRQALQQDRELAQRFQAMQSD